MKSVMELFAGLYTCLYGPEVERDIRSPLLMRGTHGADTAAQSLSS